MLIAVSAVFIVMLQNRVSHKPKQWLAGQEDSRAVMGLVVSTPVVAIGAATTGLLVMLNFNILNFGLTLNFAYKFHVVVSGSVVVRWQRGDIPL